MILLKLCRFATGAQKIFYLCPTAPHTIEEEPVIQPTGYE